MAVWGAITPSLLTWVHLKPQAYCCAEAALLAVYYSVVFRKAKWEAGAALVKYCRQNRRSSPGPGGGTVLDPAQGANDCRGQGRMEPAGTADCEGEAE